MASGRRYSCAVTSDHGVACWGDANWGPQFAAKPIRVAGLENIVGVSVGTYEVYAWRADGNPGKALEWWLEQLKSPVTRRALLEQHGSV